MKSLLIAAAASLALIGAAQAQTPAAPAAAPAASAKPSINSTVSALVANDKSRAVLDKHLPMIVQYADMIPDGVTLKQLSEMDEAKSIVTPELVKAVADDLAKL